MKLEASLNLKGFEALRKGLKKGQYVKVGVFSDHKNNRKENGVTNLQLAITHEFGGVLQIPEHEQTTYKSIKANGEFNKNGRFVKRSKSNYAQVHIVPAHTVIIPQRSFIRLPIMEKRKDILAYAASKDIGDLLSAGNAKLALKKIGVFAEGIIQRAFETAGFGHWAPNKPSTIRAKGSSAPLIDTSQLRRAVSSEVVS